MAIVKFDMLRTEIRVIPNPNSTNIIDMFIVKLNGSPFKAQECDLLYSYSFTPTNPLEIIGYKTVSVTKEAHKRFDCDEQGFQSISEIINDFRKLENGMQRQYKLCEDLQKSIEVQK